VDPAQTQTSDECQRCGYNLYGIADDQPCPECGLLAIRSRHETDELHNTRPRWLRSISWGVNLTLLALLFTFVWPMLLHGLQGSSWYWQAWLTYRIFRLFPLLGFDIAAVLFLAGALLLSQPEGYEPADKADRVWRRVLSAWAIVPVAVVAIAEIDIYAQPPLNDYTDLFMWSIIIGLFAMLPLPPLLFFQLRRLAWRAKSAHLAEHCVIVGIGTMAGLLVADVFVLMLYNGDRWGLGPNWATSSTLSLMLSLVVGLMAGLVFLWSIYLLVRFAISFWKAARMSRQIWKRDDRAIAHPA
jgi:hypothetical protein